MTTNGEAAREAIETLFNDTSVSKQVTLDDLNELQADIETKIDCLKADIEKLTKQLAKTAPVLPYKGW